MVGPQEYLWLFNCNLFSLRTNHTYLTMSVGIKNISFKGPHPLHGKRSEYKSTKYMQIKTYVYSFIHKF